MTAEKCSQCGVRKSYAQSSCFWKDPSRDKFVCESQSVCRCQARERGRQYEPLRVISAEIFSSLTNLREELKRAIIRSRPLGSQLDTCQSAVACAMTCRADCALKPTEDAKPALETTDADLDKKRAELAKLKCTSTSPSDSSLTVSSAARALHFKSVPTQSQGLCAQSKR